MLVQLHRSAHHPAIILKMAVPVRVGQHDVRSAVRSVLIGGVKKSPQVRLNPQCIEIIPGRLQYPRARWIVPGIQSHRRHVVCRQILKTPVALPQIQIIRIRMIDRLVFPALDPPQTLRARNMQRPDHQRVQNSKYHRVRTNPQRQSRHRHKSKSRRLPQHPQRKSQIHPQRFQQSPARRLAALLLKLHMPAKFNPRPPLRLRPPHAATLQIVSAQLDMHAQLLLHLRAHLRPLEQGGNAKP